MIRDAQAQNCNFQPGRLVITCISAKNIRQRIDQPDGIVLSPYLLFELHACGTSMQRKSRIGQSKGYDVDFEKMTLSFDIANPQGSLNYRDASLSIQLRNDTANDSLMGEITISLTEILSSESMFDETLNILRPGDTTTNSSVHLQIIFLRVKIGLLKLYMKEIKLFDDRRLMVLATTPDGQTRRAPLSRIHSDDAMDFWIDSNNWFSDLTMVICREGMEREHLCEGNVSLASYFKKKDAARGVSHVALSWNDGSKFSDISNITVEYDFLEAGLVHVQSIRASDLHDVSIDSKEIVNPKVILRSQGKAHNNKLMIQASYDGASKMLRNDEMSLSVVDESVLSVECCEHDEVTGELKTIGCSDVSLLPLFRDGVLDAVVNLKHVTALKDTLYSGQVQITLTFDAPDNTAFPQDQPAMTSYVLDRKMIDKKDVEHVSNTDERIYNEVDIRQAFDIFDIDKNGYIGAKELRHILIFMGEHVTDEEVDMMISMLDINGDGQVNFKEFKAMVESSDPTNEDFLFKTTSVSDTNQSTASRCRNELIMKKIEVFSRCMKTFEIDTLAVMKMWDILREKAYSSKKVGHAKFRVGYDGFCELMPVFGTASESHWLYDCTRNGASNVDVREIIMSFSSFVGFTIEEKCKLTFDMYDCDRTGYLSLEEIEIIMMGTHFLTHDLVKKRAATLMNCADTSKSGKITLAQLFVAAERFPNLLFPSHPPIGSLKR